MRHSAAAREYYLDLSDRSQRTCCAGGSEGSEEAALSDIDVADLLESPAQAAEKEKLWLEMNQVC